jgi:hypothetical protein
MPLGKIIVPDSLLGGLLLMVHYSCDCCKRPLDPEDDLRYVVKMEVYASLDPLDDGLDGDADHLEEIQDILERMEDADDERIGDDVYKQMRFDLCSECRKRFLQSPLGAAGFKQFDFSNN